MGILDRKKVIFDNIVRLRRAGREAPQSRDLARVRASLEEELGETVSCRFAAALLGVSHTAVARWVKAGGLPVVVTPEGRKEVPVYAVLDLYEAVERERDLGRRTLHVLEPLMSQARERARRLRQQDVVSSDEPTPTGHRRAELRSLAYHRALAPRLDRPALDEARYLLWKWRDQGRIDERYADRWEEILGRPLSEVRRIITEDSAQAAALRQSSPFAGMLSEPERLMVLRA